MAVRHLHRLFYTLSFVKLFSFNSPERVICLSLQSKKVVYNQIILFLLSDY